MIESPKVERVGACGIYAAVTGLNSVSRRHVSLGEESRLGGVLLECLVP
jgi:hypothetical protein